MAKSLRSKWRRKMRAVKRERYAEKELVRLKKTLGLDDSVEQNKVKIEDSELSEVATIVTKEDIEQHEKDEVEEVISMETDDKKRVFNSRSMKDQNGTYPVWMHQRKIRKNAKIVKKNRSKKNKKK